VASPVPDRATEVQTVFYRVVDGSLVRQATPPLPAFDQANAENFETARLMNNVKSMSVRVWQIPTGWVSPFASDGSAAPSQAGQIPPGIEVTLLRGDGKQFRRVFLVGA
jgi:Type II secretion system (T2SS), protein J